MVESIMSSAIRSLLQTQSTGTNASIAALKSNQKATQAIIDQLQQGMESQKASGKALVASSTPPATNLPRGSLVDMLV